MKLFLTACIVLVLWIGPRVRADDKLGDWEVSMANRQLDLTSHRARQTVTLSLSNVGPRPLTSFYVAVDAALVGKVAYIGAHVSSTALQNAECFKTVLCFIWNKLSGVQILPR